MDKLKMQTANVVDENIKRIGELFPNCLTERLDENGRPEVAIDFDQLRQELSKDIVEGPEERYQFTWPDKRNAIRLANAPTTDTLRPCREESVDFDNTQNLYIEGDNLEVLKLLRENYLGKVKMIYIDPPYNTGNDFVYNDDFAQTKGDYIHNSGQEDEEGNRLVANTESNGRFHTDWLNMIYPRLKVAKDLLSEDGVIFISIDDHEVDDLKKICSEVFGESNFVGCAGRITKKSNNKGDFWAPNFDYLLTYTRNRILAKEFTGGANISSYNLIEADGPRKGERYQLVRLYMSSIQNRNPDQRFWIDCPDGTKIIPPGTTFPPERPNLGDGIWRWSKPTFEANKDKIVIKKVRSSNLLNEKHEPAEWNVFTKTYLNDVLEKSSAKPNSFIENHINQIASHELTALNIPFDYAKPTTLINYLMEVAQIGTNDSVLDFFSGSATTAHAVMQLNAEDGGNRKFIMVQLPEATDEKSEAYKAGYKNICEIGKERIRRAGKKILEEQKIKIDASRETLDFSDDSNLGSKVSVLKPVDVGFRVLKLDSSNMQDVYYSPEEFSEKLLFENNIKLDRTDEDLLFQAMIELGIELSAKIECLEYSRETLDLRDETTAGKGLTSNASKLKPTIKVWNVAEGYLMACFDKEVNETAIKAIAKQHPYYFVLRDASLATDQVADNFEQIWEEYSKDTIRRII